MRYANRSEAGTLLGSQVASLLDEHTGDETALVLGVPRGGVVVAAEVAAAVSGDLDVVLARKIGAPGNPELAIGAVGESGAAVYSVDLIRRLRVSDEYLEQATARARARLEEQAHGYRRGGAAPPLTGRVVVVVDDGVATGATLQASLDTVRAGDPAMLICAVPVGAPESVTHLTAVADQTVCPLQPRWFRAVGEWYDAFGQTSDEEVVALLGR